MGPDRSRRTPQRLQEHLFAEAKVAVHHQPHAKAQPISPHDEGFQAAPSAQHQIERRVIIPAVPTAEERLSGVLCSHKSQLKPVGIVERVAQPMLQRTAKILPFAETLAAIGRYAHRSDDLVFAISQHVSP